MINLGNDWGEKLDDIFNTDWYLALRHFLKAEYSTSTVYPPMFDIYNALRATSYQSTSVVILGQDPYHNVNQAHGMSFSVLPGTKVPPSLLNIYKELQSDIGTFIPNNGYLKHWADQGVLLLNTILTVRASQPLSHKGKGWEKLTDYVISLLNQRKEPIIFLLWGAPARAKKSLITSPQHYVLEAPHPSPLSAYCGFFGCKHFSKVNNILTDLQKKPIDWQICNS